MKKLPIVSIAGRRNVGKSTLFNALVREKIAIVDDYPGLTRDILTYRVSDPEGSFMLCDTPGLDLPKNAELSDIIIEKAYAHLRDSAVIILLLENPQTDSFDMKLIQALRRMEKPIIVAVNKMDNPEDLENMSNFYETGFSDILPISAKFRKNLVLLKDKITALLPEHQMHEKQSTDIRIALVGRPNAGKSTLLNSFLGFERSIVSEIPGTTRDSVNDHFAFNGKNIEIIDTAGLRRKAKVKGNVEFFSVTRTIESIRKSDIVIHMIDAVEGLCENDKKIADEIMAARKPMIIALNKWDLVPKETKTFEEYKELLTYKFYKAADFPIISISAADKQRIHKLLTSAIDVKEKANRRIETGKLNRVIEQIQKTGRLPGLGTKYKVYYATQVESIPPQIKLFVRNAETFRADVIRFFEKEIQRIMDLQGVPIIIKIEGKKKTPGKGARRPRPASKPKPRPRRD